MGLLVFSSWSVAQRTLNRPLAANVDALPSTLGAPGLMEAPPRLWAAGAHFRMRSGV